MKSFTGSLGSPRVKGLQPVLHPLKILTKIICMHLLLQILCLCRLYWQWYSNKILNLSPCHPLSKDPCLYCNIYQTLTTLLLLPSYLMNTLFTTLSSPLNLLHRIFFIASLMLQYSQLENSYQDGAWWKMWQTLFLLCLSRFWYCN